MKTIPRKRGYISMWIVYLFLLLFFCVFQIRLLMLQLYLDQVEVNRYEIHINHSFEWDTLVFDQKE